MIGDIVDGNWKVAAEREDGTVELANVNNEGRRVTIANEEMARVSEGKESVSSIIHRRLVRDRVPNSLGFFNGKMK